MKRTLALALTGAALLAGCLTGCGGSTEAGGTPKGTPKDDMRALLTGFDAAEATYRRGRGVYTDRMADLLPTLARPRQVLRFCPDVQTGQTLDSYVVTAHWVKHGRQLYTLVHWRTGFGRIHSAHFASPDKADKHAAAYSCGFSPVEADATGRAGRAVYVRGGGGTRGTGGEGGGYRGGRGGSAGRGGTGGGRGAGGAHGAGGGGK